MRIALLLPLGGWMVSAWGEQPPPTARLRAAGWAALMGAVTHSLLDR